MALVPKATYWVITHLNLINLCCSIRQFERKKIVSTTGAEGAASHKKGNLPLYRGTSIYSVIRGTALRIALHFIENIHTVHLCPALKYPSEDSSRSFTSASTGLQCSLLCMGSSMKPALSAKEPIDQNLPGSAAAAFSSPVDRHRLQTDETGYIIAFQKTGVTLKGKLSFDCTTEIPEHS